MECHDLSGSEERDPIKQWFWSILGQIDSSISWWHIQTGSCCWVGTSNSQLINVLSHLSLSDPWSIDILSRVHPFMQLYSPWYQTPEHSHGHCGTEEYRFSYWLWHCKAIPSPILMHPYSNERILSTHWYASFYIYQQSSWVWIKLERWSWSSGIHSYVPL